MLWPSLFHSIIVDGKKSFLKKVCLVLKKGVLCIFLVTYLELLEGISWRDNEDVHCGRVCKSKIVFWNSDVVEKTLIAPVIARKALYCNSSSFWWNDAL